MIKCLVSLSCICFFISGCTLNINEYREQTIEEWSKSPEAIRGYVYLSGAITSKRASRVIEELNVHNNNDTIDRIRMVISTTEGEEKALDAIIAGIIGSRKPVDMISIGPCYGSGIALYAAATGKRYAFPDTDFIIFGGGRNNTKAQVEKVLAFESQKYETDLRKNSGLPDTWFPLEERMIFFTEKDAHEYNMVDEIITEMP